MKVIVNLNDYVFVKLTEQGLNVHRTNHLQFIPEDQWDRLYEVPEVDKDGYSKFHLWEFMNIFGENTYNGCIPCFEMNVIIRTVT